MIEPLLAEIKANLLIAAELAYKVATVDLQNLLAVLKDKNAIIPIKTLIEEVKIEVDPPMEANRFSFSFNYDSSQLDELGSHNTTLPHEFDGIHMIVINPNENNADTSLKTPIVSLSPLKSIGLHQEFAQKIETEPILIPASFPNIEDMEKVDIMVCNDKIDSLSSTSNFADTPVDLLQCHLQTNKSLMLMRKRLLRRQLFRKI